MQFQNPFHATPKPMRNDTACEECLEQKLEQYRERHADWTEAERRKYARFKCSARPGVDSTQTPCRGRPNEHLEAPWVHAAVIILLVVGLVWLVRNIR